MPFSFSILFLLLFAFSSYYLGVVLRVFSVFPFCIALTPLLPLLLSCSLLQPLIPPLLQRVISHPLSDFFSFLSSPWSSTHIVLSRSLCLSVSLSVCLSVSLSDAHPFRCSLIPMYLHYTISYFLSPDVLYTGDMVPGTSDTPNALIGPHDGWVLETTGVLCVLPWVT